MKFIFFREIPPKRDRPTNKKRIRKVLECEICGYKTKNLYSHSLFHKDMSEVTNYKCSECSFVTKYSRSLKEHMLLHKRIAENPNMKVKIYKCDACPFETINASTLYSHTRLEHRKHLKRGEKFYHKCPHCDYQIDKKGPYEVHLKKHIDTNVEGKIKCELCNYRTRFKNHIKRHMAYHNKDDKKNIEAAALKIIQK